MNIKFIENNKFKSNSISLNIPINIDEKITDLNLITEMIKMGSKKYDSLKKLYSKLQEFYGTYFNCYINKCGEVVVFTIYIEFLKDKYIEEGSLWQDIIEFLYEVFNNVLEIDGIFDESLLRIEKENLRKTILSLIDSKNYYAYVKCEQLATRDEPFNHYIHGTLERLDQINGKNLYEEFNNIKKNGYYFLVTGDYDEEKVKTLLLNKFSEGINKNFSMENNKFLETKFCEEEEKFDVTQTKLVITYKTPITIFNGDYYGFFVFNKILGGGYSKLYKEVRQNRNLVYYINSYYEKFKGLLSIECGVDDKNFEITKSIIEKEIKNISDGNIDEYEIINAKENIKRLLNSIKDRIIAIQSFMTPLFIFGKNFDIDVFIEEVEKVDKERIINASKEIYKSAIFSVRPNNEEV